MANADVSIATNEINQQVQLQFQQALKAQQAAAEPAEEENAKKAKVMSKVKK